jgi:hypothetical protein
MKTMTPATLRCTYGFISLSPSHIVSSNKVVMVRVDVDPLIMEKNYVQESYKARPAQPYRGRNRNRVELCVSQR